MNNPRLYVVLLGGEVQGCHVEMHDVRFVIGESIEDCYPQLRNEWVGTPQSLHVDAYLALKFVDGFEISLGQTPANSEQKLYFVNTGAYDSEFFGEVHEIGFYVAINVDEAKQRAKAELLAGKGQIHKDNLYDVDDCIALSKIGNWHIHLQATDKVQQIKPDWFGYDTRVQTDK